MKLELCSAQTTLHASQQTSFDSNKDVSQCIAGRIPANRAFFLRSIHRPIHYFKVYTELFSMLSAKIVKYRFGNCQLLWNCKGSCRLSWFESRRHNELIVAVWVDALATGFIGSTKNSLIIFRASHIVVHEMLPGATITAVREYDLRFTFVGSPKSSISNNVYFC